MIFGYFLIGRPQGGAPTFLNGISYLLLSCSHYDYPIDGGLLDGPVYGSIFRNLKYIHLNDPEIIQV